MLCGDGVRGCHGRVEAHDTEALRELAWVILWDRPDTFEFMSKRLGREATLDWVHRHLLAPEGRR